ncbi:DUF4412 domain-containing protein [Pelodictyon phaeoclathratiforme]|jgi:hypothetical protein|uniref:DUF4412 domain-containing protein n=1 Tax=Pelodictyon phaeoclathratiforme (strain DSM 5477 / BU-1) TaxID=324925 RepID=B4SG52_PELPB|nr:DUF4412 domain-containing protein [Pelodictyon phaeoclathratiforme]ACF43363.1 conserved hypothetical protein [Pelodictyon phaeoclathratiforme BU-1]MBV5289305.1 DUF4412 domain-containing protein [Pelodictyon phaeoclathratiforme]
MKTIFIALLIVLFAAQGTPAAAASKFTGIMEMALTMPNGSAKVTYSFGKSAQRMDMAMQMNKIPEQLKTTVITKASQPDQAWIINHQAKKYSLVNLKTAAENAMLLDFDSNYTLTRLGKQSIKGYSCEHIILTSTTEKLELWMTRDLGDFSTFRILQSQNPRLSNTELSKKLNSEGIEGFPVKITQYNDNGKYMMELVQIWPKELPASQFAVPAGYQKVADNQKPLGAQEKAHLKNLMEKMKKFD